MEELCLVSATILVDIAWGLRRRSIDSECPEVAEKGLLSGRLRGSRWHR